VAYIVTKESSNGYRCSCCRHSWEDTDWYDTLEEALEALPVEMIATGDYELTEVEIKDGATGEVVAWGRMDWSTGYGKYSGYKYTRWSGYRPDTGEFDYIEDQGGKAVTDKTWNELMAEMKKEKAEKDLGEARRKMAAAQRDIAWAEKQLAEP